MTTSNRSPYLIGTPGQPWGAAELAQWRAQQKKQRSYVDDVLSAMERLRVMGDVFPYGEVAYGDEYFPLLAVRSQHWRPECPSVLITGGVHGYETSGVQGALLFFEQHAQRFESRANLLVAPCVSPWAYERIQRWNFNAIDPNRSFREHSPAQESSALMCLVASVKGRFAAHIDLHETTDTDESEFRPARFARDGLAFEPCTITDGFYLVDDSANPQPEFQQSIIEAVERVTHIAPPDAEGGIIGSPLFALGVIRYDFKTLGLCAGITGARYTTTTEVYPDSPQATPEMCNAAQVAAVCAAVDFVLSDGGDRR